MSRHTYQGDKCTVTVGVDRPLQYVFGSVTRAGAKHPVVLGDPIQNYPPTEEGVDTLLQDAAKYGKCPASVREALLADLEALQTGGNLNIAKWHGDPQPAA